MKIPKKCRFVAFAFLTSAFLVSVSALGASPASIGTSKKNAGDLPAYMVVAASIDNPAYMACIRSRIKGPSDKNLMADFTSALGCQRDILKN